MAVVIRQYEQVAQMVAERTAELLGARVWVTDEHGTVVGSSEHQAFGRQFERELRERDVEYLDVPLAVGGQTGYVIVAAGVTGETISPRLARVLVELVISQAVMVARLPNRQELKSKFIADLLRGRVESEEDTLREGHILGMDLTFPRAVVLLDATDYILPRDERGFAEHGEQIARRTQYVIASIVAFFNLPNDTICASIGDGEVAILKASTTQDLVAWTDDASMDSHPEGASWANLSALKRASYALLRRLRHDTGAAVTVGVGRYHPGIRGLSRSYEDARVALRLGRSLRGTNAVHCLDGLGIAAFVGVADERTKMELATHLLSPLDQEPELLETLDMFFRENCSVSSTAAGLCIHRNTLSYRLEKTASLTGLDPRIFDEAVQIRLALLLRSLQSRAS